MKIFSAKIQRMKEIFAMRRFMKRQLITEKRYAKVTRFDNPQVTTGLTPEQVAVWKKQDLNSQALMREHAPSIPKVHIAIKEARDAYNSDEIHSAQDLTEACIEAGFLKQAETETKGLNFLYITDKGRKFANSTFWYFPKFVFEDLGIVIKGYWFIIAIVVSYLLGDRKQIISFVIFLLNHGQSSQ